MSDDGGAAQQQQEIANASLAMGPICQIDPVNFLELLERDESPVVVSAIGGIFSREYRYLTAYKGLYFFTKSPEPLPFPPETEIVTARRLWLPHGI